MSKELVIGSNRHETKVAILEEDQLVEVYFQRENEYSLAGSIHKGRVTRVLPGMQSAFVDVGLERDTFLYVSDFFEEQEDIDTIDTVEEKPKSDRRDRGRGRNSGDRMIAERPLEEKSAAVAELPAPEELIEVEEEPGIVSEPVSVPAEEDKSNGQHPEGENRFSGDRRNRRSRRRRQRGRGFPENKYAQPANSSVSQAEERPDEEEKSTEEAVPDLVVLPGESLAKYRHVASEPVVSETATAESGVSFAGDEEPTTPNEQSQLSQQPTEEANEADRVAIEEAEERKAIEQEAEELELADKVLSHHELNSIPAEEEKIAAVEEDHPAPPVSEASNAAQQEEFSRPFEPVASVENAHSLEAELAEPSAAAFETSVPFVHQEDFTSEENPPAEEGEVQEASVEEAPQTATLREGNERSMHRVSRRMRRRRGGNRFAQSSEKSNPVVGGSSGAGAATALEPVEIRRETEVEQRTHEQRADRALPSISDLLKPGQEIIVQVAKEPLGQKGARITSHVALPGRYVVFMPSVTHLGVSRKIASDEERQRLKRILQAHRAGTTGGFIVRTAGEGVPEEEIAADMNFLYSLWLDIRQKAEKKPAPVLLHYDLNIVQRILRDQVTEDFKSIWVDNEEMYESVLTFMQRFQPALVNRVKMYTRSAPIFDAFNITQELEKALRPKVWLKSGGYIVINQTEALVAIDINTGKYVGKSNRLEDTIVKTNLEAVKEIVRQIRLRDLGGIIVVDFIDMDERKNRQKVMQALEEAMRADKAPNKILQFNDFGLVAITRKRVKQSLERTLCSPCLYCEGAGYVKSVQTVIGEILVEAQKIVRALDGNKDVILRVHPDIAKVLKASNNQYLEELEEILGRPVLVKGDPMLHIEKFDLA